MKNLCKKISIITVVFNNKQTIRNAIDSVLSQTYPNIEYIIIDGNSSDGTVEVLHEYASQINVIVSETDNGIYDAMNKGLKLATGDVIGILNSDDIYANYSILSEVMNHFNRDSSLDILYGDLVYVKQDNVSQIVRTWKSIPYYSCFFEKGNVPPHPSLFLTSKVYSLAGYFNLEYRLASDYEFMLRIFKKFNFKSKYIPTLIVKMRLGGVTNTNFKNILDGNKEIYNAWIENSFSFPLLLMPLRLIKRISQFF